MESCDLTRVVTFMMSREISPRSYPEIGIPDAHRALTHESKPEAMDKVVRINTYHIQQLAYFLGKLRSATDGDGSLLDHITLMYGSGISNGCEHTHTNLPVLIAAAETAQSRAADTCVAWILRLPNLHLTLLDKLGVLLEKLGDSNGELTQLSVA